MSSEFSGQIRLLESGTVEDAVEATGYKPCFVRYWRSLSERGKRFHFRLADMVAREMSKYADDTDYGLHGIRAMRGIEKKLLEKGFSADDARSIGYYSVSLAHFRLSDIDPPTLWEERERRVEMAASDEKLREEYIGAMKRAFDHSPNPKSHYITESFGRKLAKEGHPSMRGLTALQQKSIAYGIGARIEQLAREQGWSFEPSIAQASRMQKAIYGAAENANEKAGKKIVRLSGEGAVSKRSRRH